jgi:hypothetical protein
MPRRETMLTWITRAQQLADLVGDDSIAPPIWKWFGSMVYGELWSEATNGGKRYFETSTTINANGAASYAEPADHYSTVRVVFVDASGHETPLTELRQQDEFAFKGLVGDAVAWTLVDDQLFLYPKPVAGTYKWYYFQQPTNLAAYADGDAVDVVCPAGEAFFVWGMVLLALAKQRKDVQLANAMKEKARGDLQLWAAQRNFYEPPQKAAELDEDMPLDPAERWGYR